MRYFHFKNSILFLFIVKRTSHQINSSVMLTYTIWMETGCLFIFFKSFSTCFYHLIFLLFCIFYHFLSYFVLYFSFYIFEITFVENGRIVQSKRSDNDNIKKLTSSVVWTTSFVKKCQNCYLWKYEMGNVFVRKTFF